MKKIPVVVIFTILLMAPFHPAHGQQPPTVRKIGFLGWTAIGQIRSSYEIFEQSLRELGYADGHNIAVEYRTAEGGLRLIEMASELVQGKVDVIVAAGGPAARSAKDAAKMIPIVFITSGDPVEAGYVDSLARPGGNMTGLTWLSFELVGKRLELLKEACASGVPCRHSVESPASR